MFPIAKIRRMAYNVNNPVCNAGLKNHPYITQLRIGVELLYAVSKDMGALSYPELRFAYTGLFTFKTYGLVFIQIN